MLRTYSMGALLGGLVVGCTVPRTNNVVLEGELRPQAWIESRDSTGRCDYGLEGAIGLATVTAVLGIVENGFTDDLAYMIPLSAGAGWLWGRFVMPPRSRCGSPRTGPGGAEPADTATAQMPEQGGA